MSEFKKKLGQLRNDIVTQGDRVLDLTLKAVECYFDDDQEKASTVISVDEVIDKVDVEIERASIPLLTMGSDDAHDIRSILTIVKVNNEFERIADCAVNVSEVVLENKGDAKLVPNTFRVMANSVIGMLRDSIRSLEDSNVELARQVLLFDDTVDAFKSEILMNSQARVADGSLEVAFAFRLMTVTKSLERIADHCTNICEQVIYLETGKIVRHSSQGWSEPITPES